jgi:hypothetical protein
MPYGSWWDVVRMIALPANDTPAGIGTLTVPG